MNASRGIRYLWLALLALSACKPVDRDQAAGGGCAGPVVCVLVETARGELVLQVANDSGELVYVPWLNGVTSMTQGAARPHDAAAGRL